MSWCRVHRAGKSGRKCKTCKKCYKRQRPIHKNKAKLEKVVEIQTVDFGEHPARACLADTSYRLNYITIEGDPYVGIIKCMDNSNTRTRCFMPLASWHSMLNEALPKMTYPPASTQLQVDEGFNPPYISTDFHLDSSLK